VYFSLEYIDIGLFLPETTTSTQCSKPTRIPRNTSR